MRVLKKVLTVLAAAMVVWGLFFYFIFPPASVSADSPKTLYINVIMANFSGARYLPWTKETIYNQLFASPNSVNTFYQETSFNNVNLSGKVFGPFTLPLSQTCDLPTVAAAAKKAASSDYSYSENSEIKTIVIAPFNSARCGWIGYALLGNDLIGIDSLNSNYLVTLAHEIGHLLGLLHASFYNCQNSLDIENSCTVEEYGDGYGVMGNANANMVYFNGVQMEAMGWLDTSNIATVTQSGVYNLEPLEVPGSGPKVLKIRRAYNQYYYLEYRQPLGFDRNLASVSNNLFQGALVHLAPDKSFKSYLVNPLASGDKVNPVVPVGSGFTDPLTGDVIAVASQTPQSLSINVSLGDKLPAGLSSLAMPHQAGSWILYGKTVYFTDAKGFIPVSTWPIFLSNGGKKEQLESANSTDIALIKAGWLSLPLMARKDKRVFVVSN
ncbi:MAG: hypothetical protein M1383_00885 [Patescibacteria group bacterium]|nr:hypothetical protein [Patescibacteria group bacterium]